jgi:hypothetical protein
MACSGISRMWFMLDHGGLSHDGFRKVKRRGKSFQTGFGEHESVLCFSRFMFYVCAFWCFVYWEAYWYFR